LRFPTGSYLKIIFCNPQPPTTPVPGVDSLRKYRRGVEVEEGEYGEVYGELVSKQQQKNKRWCSEDRPVPGRLRIPAAMQEPELTPIRPPPAQLPDRYQPGRRVTPTNYGGLTSTSTGL